MGNTDTAWETWGRIDPYYGVVSHENFRKERIAENRIDFFATGREFVADKLGSLRAGSSARCRGAGPSTSAAGSGG